MTQDLNDRRAENYARLMNSDHMNAHGGVFVIGRSVGLFMNFGDRAERSPYVSAVRASLAQRGIGVLGFGRSGIVDPDHPEDRDYSWAMLVEVDPDASDRIEDLREIVVRAVWRQRPGYPAWQFRVIV